MQILLPKPDFQQSATLLDDRRLGLMRGAFVRLLKVPARSQVWGEEHRPALVAYGVVVCIEWMRRGHADATLGHLGRLASIQLSRRAAEESIDLGLLCTKHPTMEVFNRSSYPLPDWFGGPVHRTHLEYLQERNPERYKPRCTGSKLDFVGFPDPCNQGLERCVYCGKTFAEHTNTVFEE